MNTTVDPTEWVGELYKVQWKALVAILQRRFGQEHIHDIEDAVSDVFLKLLEGLLDQSLIRPENPVPYLISAATHRFFEIRRRTRRCRSEEPKEKYLVRGWTALDSVLDKESSERLRSWAGQDLPRRLREVLLMRLDGMTYSKIATIMRITPEAARVYLARGLAKLRRSGHRFAS